MSVKPFRGISTVNTTQAIPKASPSKVWPVLRAMDEWTVFQDTFAIELTNDEGVVKLGQDILISSNFPSPDFAILPVTLEEYDEIIEYQRICWTLKGFYFFNLVLLVSPPQVLRTARCIELFDDGQGGTILNNWISYDGIGWPVIIATTGLLTRGLFQDFNAALAHQFDYN